MSASAMRCLIFAAIAFSAWLGQAKEWEISADFRGDLPPTRACGDIACPLDLSGAESLEFELFAENLSEFSWFLFHFWFGGSEWVGGGQLYPTEEGAWQRLTVKVPNGKDAKRDWSKVKGVRISGWRGGTNCTRLAVRNFRAVPTVASLNAAALDRLAATPARPGERRLVWAHNPNGLRDVGWGPAVRMLAENGYTDLIANLANGPSSAYPSKVLMPSARVAGKDRFAECLAACRKFGVKFHVWNVCWGGGWDLTTEEKTRFEGERRYQVSSSGEQSGRGWMCPSHPLTRQMLVDSMLELAEKGADGVHFDYIRYPDGDYCFCERCREAFEKSYGRKVDDWPRPIFGNDRDLVRAWRRFRVETITSVVRETAMRLRKTGLKCEISAAVFRDPLADPDFVGQDWAAWCEKGYVDFVCPMTYEDDFGCFRRKLDKQAAQVSSRVPRYPGIGLGVWTRDGLEVKRFADQVRYVRETGLKGFTVFDLSWKLEQLLPKVKSALLAPHADQVPVSKRTCLSD